MESKELLSCLSEEVTTIATCWKIVTQGDVLGFTDHDQDIIVDGIIYKANIGFTPKSISSDDDVRSDVLEIEGFLDDDLLSIDALQSGVYDDSKVEIFVCDYEKPSSSIAVIKSGSIKSIKISGSRFLIEVSSLFDKLSATVGQVYSPYCSASFW